MSKNIRCTTLVFSLLLALTLSGFPAQSARASSNGHNLDRSLTSPVGGWNTLMSEGFEGTFPNGLWNVYDKDGATNGEYYWASDTYEPHTGSYSAWPAKGGANGVPVTSVMPANVKSWMVYGPVDLSAYTDAEVDFYDWSGSMFSGNLYAYVSVDNTNFYGCPSQLAGPDGFARAYDLSNVPALGNVAGKPAVWIALVFDNTTTIMRSNYNGPFLDDISLKAYYPDAAPVAFNKSTPADGAINQTLSGLSLSWQDAGPQTQYYEYCIYSTDASLCDNPWVSTGRSTSVTVSGLTSQTTYHWHVRAVNSFGTTYSNGSDTAWSSFTTLDPPGAFGKTSPGQGSINQLVSLTLHWGASATAASYSYCIDKTIDNSSCTGGWKSATSTSVNVNNLDLKQHITGRYMPSTPLGQPLQMGITRNGGLLPPGLPQPWL